MNQSTDLVVGVLGRADGLTPVTHDYKAYDNKFTGTIRKIVIGVGPVGAAFDPPLEWNGVG